jgi:formiminotetrahydrofolate cyclodeaminase
LTLQLQPIASRKTLTHLQVTCELLMGAISGTAHLVRDNVQVIKNTRKRDNCLKRVDEMLEEFQTRSQAVAAKLQYQETTRNAGRGVLRAERQERT